jgi:hypothetical protein
LQLRERLRERIHLGIALHVAVNLGFALSATMGGGPVAVASASPVIASDPSPAFTYPVPSTAARQVRVTSTVRNNRRDRFDRLAMCEAAGDPTAVSPGGRYRGAFQFSLSTWQAAGGAGDPVDVSYAEQKRIAIAWAQVVEPSTQWPVCWPRTA